MPYNTSGGRRADALDRRTVLAGAGAAATGLVAGCLSEDDGDDGDGPIVIGSLQPLSGDFAPWGAAHEAGLEFAIEEINDDGGVLDRDLEIVGTDTESDAGEADTVFRRFVEEEGAVAMTGPVSSDVGIRTGITAEEMEVPMVLHMAGTHRIHTKESRYTFRMGSLPAPMDLQPQADLIEERGYESVGAIVADYEWGVTVEEQIERFFPDVDVSIEVTPLGESDFTPFLRDLPDDIDLLVATGHPPGSISIHTQAREIGLEHELTTGAGLPPRVLHEGLGETGETFAHLHVTDVFGDRFADVAERFADARDDRMDTHEGYGYVAGQLIATAIEEADSTDPTEIATAIREIELETLFAEPLRYNEWGEIDGVRAIFSTLQPDGPDYYPDGEFHLEEEFRSEPMDAEIVEPLVEDSP
ncbi:ABC transporter substrate-binding protein [Natrononativus amylolyticus]|uniref:ABC transporter substrate-binding protein n=1 Tax=Natrononativus amylolyticus TaxID=2963434 RepID=UPI0020CF1337|nr:ABC transporter substrate-binding protein [Natrononativus amylolyticus]